MPMMAKPLLQWLTAALLTAGLATLTPLRAEEQTTPKLELYPSEQLIEPSPPAPADSRQAETQPLGILIFENGDDRLVITEDGKERAQHGSILQVPAGGEVTMNVHVSRIMGSGDYVVTVKPKDETLANVTVTRGKSVEVNQDFRRGGNFVAQVPRLPRRVANMSGGGFAPLGYGRAGRWRLRSVPSGAQVKVVDQVVATDVDVARLEPDYVRAVTFTMPGFRPCTFADARISEETSAGKAWTVVTCVMRK